MKIKKILTGKYNPQEHLDLFQKTATQYGCHNMWLQKEVYAQFKLMHQEALKDGIKLKIISSIRNFERQKMIWNDKWTGKKLTQGIHLGMSNYSDGEKASKILKYSAMPCSSRHHWGTDIDLNSLEPHFFDVSEGLIIYNWLKSNAHKYGFYQVYDAKIKSQRTGYEEEKWHWSYLPTAQNYLIKYNELVDYKDYKGFLGALMAKELQVIELYVNGVNSTSIIF